jgi:hypothetical protein
MESGIDMAIRIQLPLSSPAALAGVDRGVWVADHDSRSLVCFDALEGKRLGQIALDAAPTAIAAAGGFLAAALVSGVIAAFDSASGVALWRNTLGSADIMLRSSGGQVWAAERDGALLLCMERSGPVSRVSCEGLRLFAPSVNEVYWLSREGVLAASPFGQSTSPTVSLSEHSPFGAMTACANALWISVGRGLLLVDPVSLGIRTLLEAPDGPFPHLICHDGKIAAGAHRVFVLNPMADAMLREVPIKPASPLLAIAASGAKLWALESADPVVHIADLF